MTYVWNKLMNLRFRIFLSFFIALPFGSSVFADSGDELLRLSIAELEPVFFTGQESRRKIEIPAQVPGQSDDFAKAELRLTLSCPNQRCDPWDRVGYIRLKPSKEMVAAGHPAELELVRLITPYGIGGSWSEDITDYLIYLNGEVIFEVFIDTWVGPGHPAGDGWLVSLELNLTPGKPEKQVLAIVPLLDFSQIDYGDPEKPAIRNGLVEELAPGFTSMKIRSLITGHGQGNHQNCAEFCPKGHQIRIGEQRWARLVWRNDCHFSVDQSQKGNYHHPRAGWCPGDLARSWEITVEQAELGAAWPPVWQYQVEDYINTCRPTSPVCQGCVFGTPCEYDGGLHTPPIYYTTIHAILYK